MAFLDDLLREREVPQCLRDRINGAKAGEEIPAHIGHMLTKEIKDMPRRQVDDGMVTAKLYNRSTDWLHWMPRADFGRIQGQLEHHNRTRPNQPAVFEIDYQEMLLVAMEELGPNAPRSNAPSPRPQQSHDDPISPEIKSLIDALAGAMDMNTGH